MGSAPRPRISRCLCGNTAAAAPWPGVDSGGFLGRAQVAGCAAMVCMAKGLHCRTGVLVRVYIHFSVSVVRTKQVSWAPVHADD